MRSIYLWILRIIPAVILLQTLFFKFSGSAESVFIFTRLGMEPTGRIASGIAELVAAILILIPRTTFYGAALALCVMAGAIFSHLFVLGIDVLGDHGLLFGLAVTTFVCSILLIYINREIAIKVIGNKREF